MVDKLEIIEKDNSFIISGDRRAVRALESRLRYGVYINDNTLEINYGIRAKMLGENITELRNMLLRYIQENIKAVKAIYEFLNEQLEVIWNIKGGD